MFVFGFLLLPKSFAYLSGNKKAIEIFILLFYETRSYNIPLSHTTSAVDLRKVPENFEADILSNLDSVKTCLKNVSQFHTQELLANKCREGLLFNKI
jgi:hypothetical protein